MNSYAKWIWVDGKNNPDTYGEFYSEFNYDEGEMFLDISVDSNYTVFINGRFVNSGQFNDFPYYKIYDKLDITKHLKKGINKLSVLVWYFGEANMSYYVGNASLKFKLYNNETTVLYSDENVLSRYSRAYQYGRRKNITPQLGFGFSYDATKEDDWKEGVLQDFSKSVVVKQNTPVEIRKIEKLEVREMVKSTLIKSEIHSKIFDIGFEEVGYLTIKINSSKKQKLIISFGEHINDGCVRRIIGERDFSVEIVVDKGVTEYTNYMLRFGLRYFEIHFEAPVEIEYLSVLPTKYPLNKVKKAISNKFHQKIYDVSVRTLELCMHNHYEDCPWREQALYTMDSRNQMLCGYYAFEEYRFARENLVLISKDNRDDGLISICVPSSSDLTIPSFSLHYFTQVYEYSLYSKDLTLAKEVLPKLKSILSVFEKRMENGIISSFTEKNHWNFYEWADGLEGNIFEETPKRFDAALNCFYSIALLNMQKICDLLGVEANYDKKAEELNKSIKKNFYDEKTGLFINYIKTSEYSELVNSLAVISGATGEKEAQKICEVLASDNKLTKLTLSMLCFKFDALIKTDEDKYKAYIIKEIEKKYKRMLDLGATTFWETEEIEEFEGAGSLCHGWSAMPVYYLSRYGGI